VTLVSLPRRDWVLVAAGSVLVALAYPPFHLLVPSFVALVPAVWLLAAGESDPRPVRRHLLQGFWFGLSSNALVLYWMVVALWHFTPLSALGYAATIAILGLWMAVLFGLTGWVGRRTGLGLLVTFPVLWTAVEWAIGHQGDIRFPWLGLGTSLTRFPVLVQIADVVGARGVTYLMALANTALALAWLRRGDQRRMARLAGAVAVGVLAALTYGLVRQRTIELVRLGRVALIQPNVGFDEKWRADADSLVTELLRLSGQTVMRTRPDLVLWPEAAVPGYFLNHPDWDRRIRAEAAGTGVPLVIGGLDARPARGGGWEYFNAAFVYPGTGAARLEPAYHKNYLVPIVERVPFVNPRWFGDLRWFGGAARGEPGAVYALPIGRFGILICYESAFENLARRYRRLGADFLVNLTNDAWYGRTSAAYQHPAHLVMRAIETRMGIARAGNDGISEFVDPLGREHLKTPKGVAAAEAGDLYTTRARTLYVTLGDWVGTLAVAGSLVLVAAAAARKS
jgi:apolipoprotein N-acyltransferase